jgi:hypothetical protein
MLFVTKASYLHFDRPRRNERWLNSVARVGVAGACYGQDAEEAMAKAEVLTLRAIA